MSRRRKPQEATPPPVAAPAPEGPGFTRPTIEDLAASAPRIGIQARLHAEDLPERVVDSAFARVPEAHAFLREMMTNSSISVTAQLDAAETYMKSTGDLDEELQEVVFAIMQSPRPDVRERVRAAKILLGL